MDRPIRLSFTIFLSTFTFWCRSPPEAHVPPASSFCYDSCVQLAVGLLGDRVVEGPIHIQFNVKSTPPEIRLIVTANRVVHVHVCTEKEYLAFPEDFREAHTKKSQEDQPKLNQPRVAPPPPRRMAPLRVVETPLRVVAQGTTGGGQDAFDLSNQWKGEIVLSFFPGYTSDPNCCVDHPILAE